MRRQVTSTITMLVLIGLLGAGAVWGWQQLFAEVPGLGGPKAQICSTREVKGGEKINTRQVTVSVFNGGTKSGMAGKTQDMLAKRGFGKGNVGNAPSDVQVRKVQVWSTVENDGEAELVARQFGKDVKVAVSEQDLGPGVDVIIGNAFRRLVKAPRTIELQHPEKVCVPAGQSPPPA